jgi:hypothetical protein
MRKALFLWLFVAATFTSYSQTTTPLYTVNSVKPKAGQKNAFEVAWKTHVTKYHKTDKRMVYEIMSGPYMGYYQIVEGPYSYADMDKEKAGSKEHSMDLDKSFFPYLEDNRMNGVYRWEDTSSYNAKVTAEKFVVNVNHIKFGQMPATIREMKRTALIWAKLPYPPTISYNMYIQQWSGSDPVSIQVRNLKDGWKELENNPMGPNRNPPSAFKDAYIQQYGQADWDARSKLIDDNANVQSRETYIMVLRKDLSSL